MFDFEEALRLVPKQTVLCRSATSAAPNKRASKPVES
jgi:hypothetical protein